MALSLRDAAHLLGRTGFGVTPAWLGGLRGLGSREAAVDRLMDVSRNPSDALAPVADGLLDAHALEDLLTTWWLDRMASVPSPLQEKMALFWHGYFPSSLDKVDDLGLLMRQNRLFRTHGLGSFHDLLQAVSVDPAMLLYLDNWANVAANPQENFGREVLEVFTLGPEGRTEAEVVAMTRAWTGHGLDPARSRYVFHPGQHDDGPKELFGLPPRAWDGPEALTELLFGARAVESSRFVTAKLFAWFAYPVGPDAPVVDRLAAGFRRSSLNIAHLVRSILLSEEFWSQEARRAQVRSPVVWTVAAMQAVGQPAVTVASHRWLRQAGHVLFGPPSVAGWGQNEYWLSTSGFWARAGLAEELAVSLGATEVLAGIDRLAPDEVATTAFDRFGVVDPSPRSKAALARCVERTRAADPALVVRNVVQLLLLSPDFGVA